VTLVYIELNKKLNEFLVIDSVVNDECMHTNVEKILGDK
jgi:hypothetical protein